MDGELDERRCAEMEFVTSAYTPEEAWCDPGTSSSETPIIYRRLSLNNETNVVTVQLTLAMTPGYPVACPLEIAATLQEGFCSSSDHSLRKQAYNALPRLVDACNRVAEGKFSAGEEAVWDVLGRADEWVETEWPSLCMVETREGDNSPVTPLEHRPATSAILGRRLIYSHHIIATSKRNAIRELTSHYRLTGYVKIGWPGIILIEGREQDCLDFVDEIRRMSWKHLVERGEQKEKVVDDADLEIKRKFETFQELDDMSVLAQQCREVGLESLFRTSMKIYEDTENSDDSQDEDYPKYGALVHVHHMNDGKNYRKWLRKTGRDLQCSLLVKQCFLQQDFTKRPIIVVGVIASQESVKQFLKRWRTSRVDVDSAGRSCLERKMTVLVNGRIENRASQVEWEMLHAEENINTNSDQLAQLVTDIGGKEWTEAFHAIT